MGIAYGLELSGTGLSEGLLERNGESYPPVAVEHRPGPLPGGAEELDASHAKLSLLEGMRWVTIDRAEERATYWGPPLAPDELVHPWLWPVASVFGRWHGREAFHGGALVVDGAAWVLLGAKEAGKSTLLAAHAARGGAVLADDLVVTDGEIAFTGPRCIDLREPFDGLPARPSRDGTRSRVQLEALESSVPLGGWVFLEWGELAREPVPASETLGRLARWRAWSVLDSDPAVLLALAALPAFELRRPRSWDALGPALELLP